MKFIIKPYFSKFKINKIIYNQVICIYIGVEIIKIKVI